MLLGAAASVKINAFLAAGALFALGAARLYFSNGSNGLGRFAWFSACAAAAPAAWIAKTWILTGNPAYPFFYESLGGGEWAPELHQRWAAFHRATGMGREWTDYALLPLRAVFCGQAGNYERFDGRLAGLWAVLVPLALAAGWRRGWIVRSFVVGGLGFCAWAAGSQQIRFLIPLLPFACMPAAAALAKMQAYLRKTRGAGGFAFFSSTIRHEMAGRAEPFYTC
ncbi:MAG: hypothetical protein BWZ10_02705 [candidate division BRC1 bacterium ADurb.BinA364]|nr:MAG: hypothetical protein BWZ10_02705 [candidate division BRC1 bacterium ADurb.BinA364]